VLNGGLPISCLEATRIDSLYSRGVLLHIFDDLARISSNARTHVYMPAYIGPKGRPLCCASAWLTPLLSLACNAPPFAVIPLVIGKGLTCCLRLPGLEHSSELTLEHGFERVFEHGIPPCE